MLMTLELTVIKKDNHRQNLNNHNSAHEYKMVAENSRNLHFLDFDIFRGDLNFILQTYRKTSEASIIIQNTRTDHLIPGLIFF